MVWSPEAHSCISSQLRLAEGQLVQNGFGGNGSSPLHGVSLPCRLFYMVAGQRSERAAVCKARASEYIVTLVHPVAENKSPVQPRLKGWGEQIPPLIEGASESH